MSRRQRFLMKMKQGLLRPVCHYGARPANWSTRPLAASEWLIFGDKAASRDQLVELIAARGEPYILVSAGKSFERVDARRFDINPANPDDFNRRVGGGMRAKVQMHFARVVHLWSLDMTPLEKTTAEKLEADQLLNCGSVVHLVQALTKHTVNARLWLISRGAQPVRAQPESLAVTQSPIWGLGRVIALEHPELWGGLIDLEEGSGRRRSGFAALARNRQRRSRCGGPNSFP